MRYSPLNSPRQAGFTLIEMLVVAPLVILLIGVMIGFISNLTGQGLQTRTKNAMIYDTQSALDDIETNASKATGFLTTTGALNDTPKQGKDNSSGQAITNVNGSKADTLVFTSAATTKNPYDDSRDVIYLGAGSCNPANKVYTYTTVYFVQSGSLYKRTIMPTATTCATPYQRASCAKSVMQSSPPSYCKAQDEKLLDNVASMSIKYYDGDSELSASDGAGANNVAVTISSSVKSAGSSISYDGKMRIKIVNDDADVGDTPKPPSSGGSVDTKSDPGTYTCSWESAGGATGYTVKYSFDGGSTWTSRDTNASTLNTTIDISSHSDQTITCQAFAHTSTGDISYKPTSYNIPKYNDCNLQNNWQNYGGSFASPQFYKSPFNTVVLKGLVRLGTATSGTVICQLPPGYRPDSRLIFETSTNTNAGGRVDVDANGYVYYMSGDPGYFSLSSILFQASGANWTTMSGSNNWVAYGSGYAPPQVTKDSLGRGYLEGLAKSGTTTDNTLAFTMPSGYSTSVYNHYPAMSGSNTSTVSAIDDSYVRAKGKSTASSFWSLQALFYPTGSTTWSTPSLQNSWQNYSSSFVGSRYTKASDNIVSLEGLIKGGTTTSGTTIFTLPSGYRPKDIILCAQATYGNYGRIDIYPDGRVLVRDNVNAGWLSLAGCNFVADQ